MAKTKFNSMDFSGMELEAADLTLTGDAVVAGALSVGGVTQEDQLAAPTTSQIDQTALYDVGRIYRDTNGNEFTYIQGVASVVAGDWLSFIVTSTAGSTTVRSIADAIGPCGVAIGALIAGDFGWVQTKGLNLAAGAISGGGAAAGAAVYLTGTAGLVDDVFVDGDLVFGATFTVTESSAIAGVWLDNPYTNALDIVS